MRIKSHSRFYAGFLKRCFDFCIALFAVLLLSPLYLILITVGAIAMRGNPFFVQKRPGIRDKQGNERIFSLLKFRTMDNRRGSDGQLLPDDVRLNRYGRWLRSTSLDEIPELLNILVGDMALVGPRPLFTEYLPYYTEEERHRHDVRPGLTGLAQVNGRNNIPSWESRFAYDLDYVRGCSLILDIKILVQTVLKVVRHSDILVGSEIKVGRLDDARRQKDDSHYQEV